MRIGLRIRIVVSVIRVLHDARSTPSTPLHAALNRVGRPGVLPFGTVLVIDPVSPATDQAPEHWYDAYWGYDRLCTHDAVAVNADHGDRRLYRAPSTCPDRSVRPGGLSDVECHEIVAVAARVGPIAAPLVIPEGTRLAALPKLGPADLAELSQDHIRFLGGDQRAIDFLDDRRRRQVRADRSERIYDWDELARRIVTLYRTVSPPRPTARQRIQFVGVQFERNRREGDELAQAAKQWLHMASEANRQNGDKSEGGPTDWARDLHVSRPTVAAWLDERDT